MDRIFPPEIDVILRHESIKCAWVSDFSSSNPADCLNCGGTGWFVLSVATKGPFESPKGICKSEMIGGRLMWWPVQTQTFPCPECKGSGRKDRRVRADPPTKEERSQQVSLEEAVELADEKEAWWNK